MKNMDTDSLYKRRVSQLTKQPDTLRGKSIVWYASQAKRPVYRVAILFLITLIVIAHVLMFTILLKDYVTGVSLIPLYCLIFPIYRIPPEALLS